MRLGGEVMIKGNNIQSNDSKQMYRRYFKVGTISGIVLILITGLVSANISANFSAEPSSGIVPLDVTFTDYSTGNISGWNWSFGDGSSFNYTHAIPNNSTSIKHRYETPGLYNASLYVYNLSNTSANSTLTLPGGINAIPYPLIANFSAVSVKEVAPFHVQFLDFSEGLPVAWRWDFGDGTKINEQGPNHTYEKPGVYNVSLTVFDIAGKSNVTIQNGSIIALSPTVKARLTYVYADPLSTKKIQFFDKSEGIGLNQWQWDFGDQSNLSSDQHPIHEYSSSGRYTVNLWTTNGYANSSSTYEIGIR